MTQFSYSKDIYGGRLRVVGFCIPSHGALVDEILFLLRRCDVMKLDLLTISIWLEQNGQHEMKKASRDKAAALNWEVAGHFWRHQEHRWKVGYPNREPEP